MVLAPIVLAPAPAAAAAAGTADGAAPDVCGNLAAAVTAAARIDPARGEVAAARALAADVRADARSWVAGSASAYGNWINDRFSDSVGLREYEGGVSVPLRLPGQHRALGAEARATARTAGALERVRRLEVAGRVRETYWDLAAQRVRVATSEHEVEHLQELDDLVADRVARGDAAPLERDLSAAEVSAAREALATARGELEAARHAWRMLTGCAEAPRYAVEAPAPFGATGAPSGADPKAPVTEGPGPTRDDPGADPRRALAEARWETAAARLRAERARPGQAPALGLLMRRERGGAPGNPFIDSLGVTLTVPLGRSGTRIRARGEAARELASADAERLRLERRLDVERRSARQRLRAARDAAGAAEARRNHVEAALARARRAYAAGEWDTVELLRIEAIAAEARLAADSARTRVGRATARYNQARGVLP